MALLPRILSSLFLLVIMSAGTDQQLCVNDRICLCAKCFDKHADTPPLEVPKISRGGCRKHWRTFPNPIIQLEYWKFADSTGGLTMRPAFTLREMLHRAQQASQVVEGVAEEHVAGADGGVAEEHVGYDEEEERSQAMGKLPGYDGSDVSNRLKIHGSAEVRNAFALANDDAIKYFLTLLAGKIKHNESIAAVETHLKNFKQTALYTGSDWGRTPDNFNELLIFADVHGWVFIPEYVYDVCSKCYYVYRGPEEFHSKAESCRRCHWPRSHCKKYYYRCALQTNGLMFIAASMKTEVRKVTNCSVCFSQACVRIYQASVFM